MSVRLLFAALALSLAASSAQAWPDTPLGRVEALAVVQGLNVELLTHPSATATLDAWCASHHMAAVPKLVAHTAKAARPKGTSVVSSVRFISGVSRDGTYQLSASDSRWSPQTSCTWR